MQLHRKRWKSTAALFAWTCFASGALARSLPDGGSQPEQIDVLIPESSNSSVPVLSEFSVLPECRRGNYSTPVLCAHPLLEHDDFLVSVVLYKRSAVSGAWCVNAHEILSQPLSQSTPVWRGKPD